MNIIFFRHSLLNRGADKMIVAHASHLAALGHSVTIQTNIADTLFACDARVKIRPMPFKGKLGTLVSSIVLKHEADVVIADIVPLICTLIIRNHSKVVFFAQGYDESYYASLLMKNFVRALSYFALKQMKVSTIAVSSAMASYLRSNYGALVTVAENGVDTSIFRRCPDPELIGRKTGRHAILMLSRGDYCKGFDVALQVVRLLGARTKVPFEIWTVGDEASGKFEGIPHHDFGYVRSERMSQLLSSADIFLYPSRHEGSPLMVMEAFACRCPVVTTGAVPFAVHEVNALVGDVNHPADLAEQLSRLLEGSFDPEGLVAMGEAFSKKHSLSNSSSMFAKIITGSGHVHA